jgi:HK97 family phage portal protein
MMKAFARTIAFARNVAGAVARVLKAGPRTLSGVDDRRGWWPLSSTWNPGNWQSDVEVVHDEVLAQPTLFACMTLIAADIGKCCLKLVERDAGGIWDEVESPAFSPVLRKPNGFQTTQLFIEQWVFSLLSWGNAYMLKVRDQRGVVIGLYVLDAARVRPLVAPNGMVYYQLQEDDLSKVTEAMPAVPASEIIHDRINCLFHPLVGISPIFACGLASTQALKIMKNSAKFFENMSRPSGVLTAPGKIGDETALRLKDTWDKNYSGDNIGKTAVLGDGLKYEAMSVTPLDAQLVEQLKLSAEQVCAVFHVPGYMVGAAPVPANSNVQALTTAYFGQCLQKLMKRIEDGLDAGLGLVDVKGKTLGTMFDLDDLLRMDTATLTTALVDQVKGGISKPNEARRRLNLKPVPGGDTPYLQMQNFSLAALDKRDRSDDPFGKPAPPAPAPVPPPADDDAAGEEAVKGFFAALQKELEVQHA